MIKNIGIEELKNIYQKASNNPFKSSKKKTKQVIEYDPDQLFLFPEYDTQKVN